MAGKNRCVIQLQEAQDQDDFDAYVSVNAKRPTVLTFIARVYGSHSEAKKQLPKWLPAWPDAKIVDEGEL